MTLHIYNFRSDVESTPPLGKPRLLNKGEDEFCFPCFSIRLPAFDKKSLRPTRQPPISRDLYKCFTVRN
jgi:hypothetical protein